LPRKWEYHLRQYPTISTENTEVKQDVKNDDVEWEIERIEEGFWWFV